MQALVYTWVTSLRRLLQQRAAKSQFCDRRHFELEIAPESWDKNCTLKDDRKSHGHDSHPRPETRSSACRRHR
ncbi:hypothetical protein AGR5A_Cc170439 [Agrobacterium genomosp. 5 str. CFBP 6626]|nr:hypothetical protein AGR5A_Cc170439 [Agrobacterium genomosp. 5 str. CFBP 6626]